MSSNQSLSIFLLPNIGNVKAIKILKSINWKPNKYSQTDFIDQLYKNNFDRIDELTSLENTAKKRVDDLNNSGTSIINYFDKDYPQSLKMIKNPPLHLFIKGNLNIFTNKNIAIIGSRKPSSTGKNKAYQISKSLSKESLNIISGLALGCDTEAHKGALSVNGNTLAVLPGPLDNIYPSSNNKLSEEILEKNGCLLSEYLSNTKIINPNFVQRDRLQSGLSSLIIVIETSIDGGTMHTVNFAIEQNKKIACFGFNDDKNLIPSGNKELFSKQQVLKFSTEVEIKEIVNKIDFNISKLPEQQNFF